ncbi:deoxyribose-phosphate aldolase [Chroococcidiopsis thermalis]|uniref:Deoxyribose-phosphate aldolase n=1 Tax=Chroococcidiopsis thermalis (strain PCC 7203) TaxID=251229 RepID=K9TS89_CHRTP|nr:deoxyribose-phosphate aldolase [Chroococcidiopsis thermalis]AFY85712.1 deoxyribose-phosphate aldolase [Chroococcidiopsis thermalis PCC 7203]PSB41517.1 deoxyribose-phosphate aldolase [Cyanosarcina cf. burmensis CCALA 770]
MVAAADYREIDIAPLIDHTLLIPTATPAQVEQWCMEADRFGFAAVCINPVYVRQAAELLHGKKPKVCTVIGFPTGATTAAVKLYEAQEAADSGATELDVVINLGWLKAEKTEALHREIAEICEETGQTVKVILETTLLTEAEKRLAADICMDAGAAFLKTSTGWNGGATVADVRLLKEIAKERVGIKASGGIRTIDQAIELILAGATRLGTSRSVDLLRQRDNLEKGSYQRTVISD